MSPHDEELGLPGNREIVERALRTATTQVLHLAPDTGPANRTLAERAADLVRGFECVPALRPVPARSDGPVVVPVATPAAIPEPPVDIAGAYLRARTEVTAALAEQLGTVDQVS
jgi:hypothetical protein